MTKVAEFHTTGIEDVDELIFHNQSECPIGQEITKKGTAAPGQGYFRTLCVKCKSIAEGWEGESATLRSEPLAPDASPTVAHNTTGSKGVRRRWLG